MEDLQKYEYIKVDMSNTEVYKQIHEAKIKPTVSPTPNITYNAQPATTERASCASKMEIRDQQGPLLDGLSHAISQQANVIECLVKKILLTSKSSIY